MIYKFEEGDNITITADFINYLEKLQQENIKLNNNFEKLIEKIGFYKNTEWGLRSYEILELFEKILKGELND